MNAGAISMCILDKRFAENLDEMAMKNPKLKESIANGATPFRVCDVAYNVMQEIRAFDNPNAPRLTRSQSIEARDGLIRQATGVRPDEEKAESLPNIVAPPRQSPNQASEAKPPSMTPSEEPTSSTPWRIIVVLIVAACGLLWLLFKRHS